MPRLLIKAVPGAARDQIAGWLGERLKVRVAAPPEHGKANEAICVLLAGALRLRPRDVTIVAGAASPEKTIELAGLTDAELAERLPPRP